MRPVRSRPSDPPITVRVARRFVAFVGALLVGLMAWATSPPAPATPA